MRLEIVLKDIILEASHELSNLIIKHEPRRT